MAYASWSVTFGEQPSAAKWNILGTNDASFNDGTGIANAAIGPSKLATGAATSVVATTETTTSATYTGLTTPNAVTVTVGANGLLLVTWQGVFTNTVGNGHFISVALSSANTAASSDAYAITGNSNVGGFPTSSYTKLFTGLTPGSTTVTLQFRVNGGSTFSGSNRSLVAIPL